MKTIKIIVAAGILSMFGMTTAANAAPDRRDRDHYRYEQRDHRGGDSDRGDRSNRGDRSDRGRYERGDRDRRSQWNRRHQRCHTEWRHHRRIRVCR